MTTRRRLTPSPASLSESSVSDWEDRNSSPKTLPAAQDAKNSHVVNSISVDKILSSTLVRKRLSRQSSLSWGHKPSPLIGASCFCFLLPVPFLLRACCHLSAFLLGCVTVSSYLSDHVYTGLESWAHALDRALAPMAFSSCLYSTYANCGWAWASLSLLPVKCHVMANYYSCLQMYDEFVVWHSLWHLVGAGLIVVCFAVNGTVGTCWEGTGWEELFQIG